MKRNRPRTPLKTGYKVSLPLLKLATKYPVIELINGKLGTESRGFNRVGIG